MGAAITTPITMGVTYCCMTAANSLCQACFGNVDSNTNGRKRSVLLLTMAIALAFWMQYGLGPNIVAKSGWTWSMIKWVPGLGQRVYHAWYDSCKVYASTNSKASEADSMALLAQCAGNSGVYRCMSLVTMFFAAFAVATKQQPTLNRQVWPAKYTIYLMAVALSIFFYSAPFFTGYFLWLARIGATLFMVLQQVILIDVAYNWNEDWVDKADQADRMEYGSGSTWLQAIVAMCVFIYSCCMAGIIILYQHFGDCPENSWIISLTLLAIVGLTAIQLSGNEGSLLTSSLVSLYATYLAYSMVSKNPNASCNPQLGNNDVGGIIIGLSLTAVSLAWTGWSWTAQERLDIEGVQTTKPVTSGALPASARPDNVNLDVPFLDPNSDQQPMAGLVMEGGQVPADLDENRSVWKLNVVLVLISCFVAMILTGWGTMESTEAANPTVGRFNMAMIGVSQWLAILLYVWTLVAPRLFPDREFS